MRAAYIMTTVTNRLYDTNSTGRVDIRVIFWLQCFIDLDGAGSTFRTY